METDDPNADHSYTVHEVNHTVEFKALDGVTEGDVPAEVVDWLEGKAEAADETAVAAP